MKTALRVMLAVMVCFSLMVSAGYAEQQGEYSGFLENYPTFEPAADQEGALFYRKAGVNVKSYTKFMIDPIEIWIAPDSKYKGIKPDELKILSDTFRHTIVDILEPNYPVVNKPGPDVLGIRIAITNVYMTKKKRGLLGYTPIGLVVSTTIKAIGDNMSLEDAVIEIEILDSQTSERLGARIDQQSKTGKKKSSLGKLSSIQKGATSWEEIEEALKFFAQRIRERMDAEHGK